MADLAHVIVVQSVDGGGFAVTVEPPVPGHDFDQNFDTYRSAHGYAGGLRMVRHFPVRDHAESEVAR
jgi:hypothetical protein